MRNIKDAPAHWYLPARGQVIMSPKFAFGYRSNGIYWAGAEDAGLDDITRAEAKFVVMEVTMGGGATGTGHTGRESYPDGLCVEAKRLTDGGEYDSDGEMIRFFLSGAFRYMVDPKDIRIIGTVKVGRGARFREC